MAERSTADLAEALIALGGNIGDVRQTFDRAIAMLCDGAAVRLLARSSDYRTPPWGVADQPPFINAVIAVATSLPPRDLLARALTIERALGRDRKAERRWGPRMLDLDILAYGDLVLEDAGPDAAASAPVRTRLRPGRRLPKLHRSARSAASACAMRWPGWTQAASRNCRRYSLATAWQLHGKRPLALPGQAWHFASMTAAEPFSFAEDFPAATHDEWRRLVDSALKGAPFQRLESKTYDSLTIEPLYDRAPGRTRRHRPRPGRRLDADAARRSSRPGRGQRAGS